MESNSNKKIERIQWLDMLRGIAIILVVLFHFTTRYQQKYPNNRFINDVLIQVDFGWIGVHLFFMISGFIIYLTIQKKKGPFDFLVARLSRLMPPYWAAIMLILLFEYIHTVLFSEPNRNDLITILFNIFMVPDIFKAHFLDGAFWSLYVEIKFYLMFAILWQVVNMKAKKAFYISYFLLLFAALFHNYIHFIPMGDNLNYFLIFWAGIAACKVIKEDFALWEYSFIIVLTTISTLGIYNKGSELIIGIPLFGFFFVVSPFVLNKYPKTTNLLFPIAFIGRISYSFYLIHQPVGYTVLGLLAVLSLNYNLAVIFAIIICGFIASLGFIFIEKLDKPIAAYINNKIYSNSRKAVISP